MKKENMIEEIKIAIQNKNLISFDYKGGTRIVEPFLLGRHKDKGNIELRAWFLSGYSKSKEYNTWKLYKINEMSNLKILDNTFSGNRPDYNPNDKDMSEIYTRI